VSLVGFIKGRFTVEGFEEIVNPWSSMGYRIHEAWAVWDERTLLGHGPGAPIHLFFTQLKIDKFIDWWAIHSGYFEYLHKFGFVGLGIILWMFGSYYFLARRMTKSSSRAVAAFGGIISAVLMNTAIVSITSGYFFRHGVIVWVLLFFIAERLRPRLDAQRKKTKALRRPQAVPSTGESGVHAESTA
jgi:O-antigen ligase